MGCPPYTRGDIAGLSSEENSRNTEEMRRSGVVVIGFHVSREHIFGYEKHTKDITKSILNEARTLIGTALAVTEQSPTIENQESLMILMSKQEQGRMDSKAHNAATPASRKGIRRSLFSSSRKY